MYSQILHYEAHRHQMQHELAKLERRRQLDEAQQAAPRPSRPRMALVTWVGAYSMISVILYLLGPYMADWPLLVRTAVLSGLMVVTLTWVVLPSLTRIFRGWLIT
jgi:antibiotic biosynthesis monooxygenase (ABM) superfamily enzyme